MFVMLLRPFLKHAIWRLQDTLNFTISLFRVADLVYPWARRQPASCPRCGKVTSQKLKPTVALRVESWFILTLLKRLHVYREAQGSQLWASA